MTSVGSVKGCIRHELFHHVHVSSQISMAGAG
jgi:hypothetical protein